MKIKNEYIVFTPKVFDVEAKNQSDLAVVKIYELIDNNGMSMGYVAENIVGRRLKIPVFEFNKLISENEKYFELPY